MAPVPNKPRKAFGSSCLAITAVAPGRIWWRLYLNRYPDPLGFGYGPSRFSDPDLAAAPPQRFGVIYLGGSVKVCFVEAILRDRTIGRVRAFPIEWSELEAWTCAEVRVVEELRLVDLRGGGLLRMGIPTDVARARSQRLGRTWSRAIWAHDQRPDGLIYDSRLNGETNIAIYDRARGKLAPIGTQRLVDCHSELAAIINDFDLAII